MEPKPVHAALEPLSFLTGKWRSLKADGKFPPRVEPFTYCEELEFTSVGQPMLNYRSTAWHPVQKFPMHQECGFLKIKPGTNQVSFLVAHNFGLTTVEEGNVIENVIRVKSLKISRASSNKEPAVTEIERTYTLREDGKLELAVHMATSSNSNLSEHLLVVYEKIVECIG